MKILHVCAPAQFGGLESVVMQLTSGLRDRSIDAQVAVVGTHSDHGVESFAQRLTHLQLPVHRIAVGSRQYSLERSLLRDLLSIGRFDVLHTHGYRADVVHGSTARRHGCAHVSTLHGFTSKGIRGRLYEYLQIRQVARGDAIVAVSSAIASRVIRHRSDAPVQIVRNAIAEPDIVLSRAAARLRLGLSDGLPCIGWVGRLSHEKGPDLALRARALVPFPVRLVFVGDGPMRASLEAEWAADVQAGTVVFAGLREDARSLMSAFDAIAITSRTEGTPITLLEAMWSGTPTVVSAVGGIPEVVDRTTSMLVPPDADALGQAFSEVISQTEASAIRADAAKVLVRERFGIDQWLDAHVRIYLSVTTKALHAQ